MDKLNEILGSISGFLWGIPLIVLIVGSGIYLTIRVGALQLRLLPTALRLVFSKKHASDAEGDISQFQALTTALAATVGTGNIVGVATAVILGGPGAIFWMWFSAFFGMATKYSEAILAVRFRVKDSKGQMAGGPMYYLEHGLKQKWLAVLFALFGVLASFGIGNGTQSNSVAGVVNSTFKIDPWITGIILTIFVGLVILGGIQSIGKVTAVFVPVMALFYLASGLIIIIMNITAVPEAFMTIIKMAFSGEAAAGGAIGAAIRYGVARGVFSNEAGLGSAPIAAAAAKTDLPGRQALISMTQVFFDTFLICSITGLTIVMSGVYTNPKLEANAVTTQAFGHFLGSWGPIVVAIGLIFFASSTILGWAYYGEKCFQYLFKNPFALLIYRIIFVGFVYIGATIPLDIVWTFSDVANGLMAIPNLIGLIGLSGIVVFETKRIKEKLKEEKEEKLNNKAEQSAKA
ncbi:alanine/glycine:cation symporter family protein [Viridibacillus arvi]|uniref:alanine/glycine:cation symporter family protein n=1 Tax=Viridibacillus arvi TaxID=263475 RepID=UPI00187BACE6|nr:sodium:alanine symporter family protein [Viridibacillus sp. JNUCC-6]QOV09363.1 sodium:alanine symporter family protein [Viridibacillus sp. JNUCC-6]